MIENSFSVQDSLTTWGCYWFFAVIAACAAIMGITVLPETKGKTLAEVSEYFYICCSFGNEGTKEDEAEVVNKEKETEDGEV